MSKSVFRGVAQPGRVLRSGRRSRRFESSHPDHSVSSHWRFRLLLSGNAVICGISASFISDSMQSGSDLALSTNLQVQREPGREETGQPNHLFPLPRVGERPAERAALADFLSPLKLAPQCISGRMPYMSFNCLPPVSIPQRRFQLG